ncbi:MAG: 3-methyl-2-oxobutanoate dehydrogenase subunit VorB [Ignavibacteria bacterium GWA2_55_11]|nr:MAG: 3-methyl-2-oxobutanoate dehydrogenase subunit VorB [Ignavibacteria bacterium GWA2_55_11]OGU43654.1 MAG: 3-methyl-2-oxobutanoate dehydrogenase subunit VorB [Ignavibacteria bacterium GWC2_56_12]OGU63866.1 MAG: 3-methyl-2-oxobutanoate dehydrogenase subunit VorB [Ignavibacteria bacterium RIFCSPHIGHO2_02_FULL_56_12]OGU69042.1 MAG: 3-methyl-2-oxobutanoate dehydrogenase subunit VorB [Ignavibacteria bacterium RIFCSPLOWO2_02_FULL_55_14]OGU76422.1 MAG: 3-methyl-2-oxobutanoate dehydrogenase subuni
MSPVQRTTTLMKGNEALAEAALRSDMDAYFGYPITPQSEILEYLIIHGPKRGSVVLQAESEVAAINMVYGAAGAGARVMISSSSPGISLMQEGLSYIASAQIPCLVVNVQRGGPGLGTIQPAQGDYFQATKGGGHGDYRLIVLAPSSVQEMADFVPEGFRLAEKYRNPVMILSDGALGQMMESVQLPEQGSLPKSIPAWATRGKPENRERNIITSLFIDPERMEQVNIELQKKYAAVQSEARAELDRTKDAEIVLVAFGLAARICQKVVDIARERGKSVGLFRPITLYPFPTDILSRTADHAEHFLVVEMNAGQMVEDVRLAVNGRRSVDFTGRMGGIIPTPEEILQKIESLTVSTTDQALQGMP